MAEKRKNLGRGISALLGEDSDDYNPAEASKGGGRVIPIEFLAPSRFQPRHRVDEEQIQDLVASVREKGILQPILVRQDAKKAGYFEIIAGERRWRAAQLAQLHEVPVIVRDFDDREAMEIALIENLQRQDLTPLEEAEGYRRLMDEYDHTQEELAKVLGKSRSHVANMMRLLGLPDPVKEMLESGALSSGHARALLNAEDPVAAARQVVNKGLNVRQTERLTKKAGARRGGGRPPKVEFEKDADTLALERDLTNQLGLRVEIRGGAGGGALVLHYATLEQLDDLLYRLSDGAQGQSFDDEDGPLDLSDAAMMAD